ncbi:MAG: DUF1273 family protein [Clostridia bacterium]|nr:DUF1273 family protein [Clostridia bacterium]
MRTLIENNGIKTFIFGSNSEFDDLCYSVVTDLQKIYPHIKRVYIRAEFPCIDDNYEKYLLEKYEETYFPLKIINAGKAVYLERNFEMIDKSDVCVLYYDVEKHRNKKHKSGTKKVYEYALKKGVEIINIYDT